MSVRVVRRTCHCCGGKPIVSFIGLVNEVKRVLAERGQSGDIGNVKPDYDARGRYWCTDCWQGTDGRKERRLGKLRALAENEAAPLPERENALRRIFEIEGAGLISGAGMSEKVLKNVLNVERKTRQEGDALQAERFTLNRRRHVRRRATWLAAIALPLCFAGQLPLTGSFYSMVALSLIVISYWYQFKPDEKRWTMDQAVAYAVWFSFLAWLAVPVTAVAMSWFVEFV